MIAKVKRFALLFELSPPQPGSSLRSAPPPRSGNRLCRGNMLRRCRPHKLDHSGRKRVGKTSFYAKKFTVRKMASGKKMNPQGSNAASKTLPLDTRAKVTNLETGQSAFVNIEDRGSYVKGRIIDLSPSTAEKIGIGREEGVGQVEVTRITIPQPDGSVKPGAAANDTKADKRPAEDRGK